MATNRRTAWTGWVIFAGSMILVIGSINVIQGIFALIYDDRVAVIASNFYIVDLTGWGWTLLLSGVVLFLVGLGLLGGQTWARIASIVIVGVHALTQVVWLGAYPIWSLMMIALDTVVLYALTARWSAAQEDLGTPDNWGPAQRSSSPVA